MAVSRRLFAAYFLLVFALVLALFTEPWWFSPHLWRGAVVPDWEEDAPEGQFFTLVDAETGEEVFHTARMVYVGDMAQTPDNRLYEVTAIEGFRAMARLLRTEAIAEPSAWFPVFLEEFGQADVLPKARAAEREVRVAIYHTHSAESFRPSDGSSSIRGNGGILKVGDSFTADLKAQGVQVEHTKTIHCPHDKLAYQRSRRTAVSLMRQNQPQALLDVHRDALERRFYTATVKGRELAQVQLVVGRQNPNMRANKQFAQELKAAADKRFPGLVKGIFFGRGSYNQELHPRAVLLEMGTHKSTRAEAKDGAELFAQVVAAYLGGAAPDSAAGFAREGSAARTSLLFILGLLVAGGVAYLFLSTGSVAEMKEKVRQFVGSEFLGSRRKNRGDGDDTNPPRA